jgi:2-oxoglutarate ferredoxin oxidoreductase subunit gamma
MQSEIMFAGFGGQGILLSGTLLAKAAMQEGFEVAWVPSYGPEMRGGTAYCTVVIGDRPIGSPIIKNPLHLVAMNGPSLEKFAPVVKPSGVILVNASLISFDPGRKDCDVLNLPVVEIATDLGNAKAANIVALAAFVTRTRLVSIDTLKKCVETAFKKKAKLIPLNLKAVDAGVRAAQ